LPYGANDPLLQYPPSAHDDSERQFQQYPLATQ